jgi:acetyltransferase-like isoleucine patch superfamily enzyme
MTTASHTITPSDLAPGLLLGANVSIGADCDLGIRAVIHDNVMIGEGVVLGANVVIHAGTIVGDGCRIADNVVLGKPVYLSKSSTAKRGELPPLNLGAGTTVGAGTVVCAGTSVGPNSLLGDQVSVRERCTLGERVIVGRGTCVENDTTIGDRTKIQSNAYITAYMTIEQDVFIAPCVMTTNDNFMGRTEQRFEMIGGPTIRRGARVGGGCVLLPNVVIGEEAFIGAGAVVTRDAPAGKVLVGTPARVLRDVPVEELLDA